MKLYSFYNLPASHEICHIFEHVILRGFSLEVEENGKIRGTWGWINATTTDNSIFFDTNFYNPDDYVWFEKYLKRPAISIEIIEYCLKHIEAEIYCKMKLDKEELLKILKKLANNISTGSQINYQEIEIIEEELATKEIATILFAEVDTDEDLKWFIVFRYILADLIQVLGLSNIRSYPRGISPLNSENGLIQISNRYTVECDEDTKQIERDVNQKLSSFNFENLDKSVFSYFKKAYLNEDYMRLVPMEIYQMIGAIFSREELAEVIDVKNFKEIARKIKVKVVDLRPEDIDNFPWGDESILKLKHPSRSA